jgi:hypothetical protein
MLFAGAIAENEALFGLIVIFVIVTIPSVVRWHRHIISEEEFSWWPRLPDRLSLVYVAKLMAATFVFTAIQKIASSIANDLLLPTYGAVIGGRELLALEWLLAPAFGILIAVIAFVSIFGKWMLHLPEGTLDSSSRGLQRTWPPNGKRSFLSALSVVYLIPPLLTLVQENFLSDDFVTTALADTAVSVICALVGLSILTVAYRRNLHHSRASLSD